MIFHWRHNADSRRQGAETACGRWIPWKDLRAGTTQPTETTVNVAVKVNCQECLQHVERRLVSQLAHVRAVMAPLSASSNQ